MNCTNFDQTLTKREVLKQIATVFDPLGIFSPITLKGKLFLQDLWIKILDWDESLSDEDKMKWTNVKEELDKLKTCKFPRYIGLNGKNSDLVSYLLGFCDASKKGTSRQRSGKGTIRKRFPLQKPRWEKTNNQVLIHVP